MCGKAKADALPCPHLELIAVLSDEVGYIQQLFSNGLGYLTGHPTRITCS